MPRPYIICHMVTSIDGKVTGEFLSQPECEAATDVYYELNREYNRKGANGFICGRVTMEGSFTGGWHPDLAKYPSIESKEDFIPDNLSGFYAVSFDPKGKLGWKSNKIIDEDPGYNDAQIIEVLTTQVDGRYLGYLQDMEIPYIIAGKTEIDVKTALEKLYDLTDIVGLLLEGGSIVNGYFERANVIDELSLVVAPIVADTEDKPLFMNSTVSDFKLIEIKKYDNGVVWMNYNLINKKRDLIRMMFDSEPIENFKKLLEEDLANELDWGFLLHMSYMEKSYESVGGDDGFMDNPPINHARIEYLSKLIVFLEENGIKEKK